MRPTIYSVLQLCLAVFFSVSSLSAGIGGGSLVRTYVVGGVDVDSIAGMAMLPNGDVVVCGRTSAGVTTTVPGLVKVAPGLDDAFVAVVSADLTTLKYWTYYGGPQDDQATGVAVLPNGTIAVTGETSNPNFTMSPGAFAQLYGGQIDGYIIKLSAHLDTLLFGTYIPGLKNEHPRCILVDDAGSVYVCGHTNSPSGFPTTNGYDRSHNGGYDGFVLKMSPNGGSLTFSTYFGGGGDDFFRAMAITGEGGLALTGYTTNSTYEIYPVPTQWDWEQKPRPYDHTFNGGLSDAVLTIFTADGSAVITSGFFGGAGDDIGNVVKVDIRDDILIAGSTTSIDMPTSFAVQPALKAGADAFMTKLGPKGTILLSSTYIGGSGNDAILQASETTNNRWLLLGSTTSRDFSAEGGGTSNSVGGPSDLFIAHASTAEISYFTTFGWGGVETGTGFLQDSKGDVYLCGATNSPTISWSGGSISNKGPAGTYEGFISKWAFGTLDLVNPRGSEKMCPGQNFNVTWSTLDLSADEEFDLQISADGETWTNAATKLKTRSYQWKVPATLQPGTDYWMRAKSAHGHISKSDGAFTIRPASAITTGPVAQHVCQGEDVVLNVIATGEALTYQWKRNGAVITGATTSQLTISHIPTTSAGSYEVVVNSACGSVSSTPVTVEVDADVVITDQPADKVVNKGQTLSLQVVAKGLGLGYIWKHDGQTITNATTAQLQISNVTESDSGTYQVIIHGSCGDDTSRVATVQVKTFPVSVEDVTAPTFSLAPNPTNDVVDVTLERASDITIVDMSGRIVLEFSGTSVQSYPAKIRLNLESLTAGTYVVSAGKTAQLLTIVR